MDEWSIVLAISTLAGLFILIGTPILKLNSTIQKLNTLVSVLSDSVKENKEKQNELTETVNDHETRITILEQKGDKK